MINKKTGIHICSQIGLIISSLIITGFNLLESAYVCLIVSIGYWYGVLIEKIINNRNEY